MSESKKNIYFASDFHLGIPDHESSLQRERKLISWLDHVSKDAAEIYLMGDLFDFWFEYRTVVPKGFARLFGKLAEITDSGIPVHLFRGNHDVWAFGYMQEELGLILHRHPEIKTFNGKLFYLAHGDGLGPGDKGYKFLKKVFASPINQWLFSWLHPDIGAKMGLYFSGRSRIANNIKEHKQETQIHVQNEMLYKHAQAVLAEKPEVNYFVFGHRHVPVIEPITNTAEIIILGDWINHFSYAIFDGERMQIKYFQ